MELRQIIQAWQTLVLRLDADEPRLGRPLRRAAHPIAAERYADGKLLVVLGCWLLPDLEYLADPDVGEQIAAALAGGGGVSGWGGSPGPPRGRAPPGRRGLARALVRGPGGPRRRRPLRRGAAAPAAPRRPGGARSPPRRPRLRPAPPPQRVPR